MNRSFREFIGLLCVSLFFNLALVSSHAQYDKVEVRAHPENIMTVSDVTTPVRLRGDKETHSGKIHFRTKNDDTSKEHQDEEFKNPHYKIKAFGSEMIIELLQDEDLISPAYTTTYSFHNSTSGQAPRKGSRVHGCFYKGKVLDQPSSQVTVSICDGLTGAIRTEDFDYLIEPNDQQKSKTGEVIEHSIHRRSIRNRRTRSADAKACGVNDQRNHQKYTRTFMSSVDQFVRHIRSKRSVIEINKAEPTVMEKEEILSRQKRGFSSKQHFIETMVVADKAMSDHHGDDLEHYILTIMMVANRVFAHPSLGNAVTISVVKIMQAGNDLPVSTNAAKTLRDFCNWQSRHNTPDDDDPNHFDLAVLLTRKDLCGDTCDTLGMADVGAMCSSKHSCAVVEDDGLSAAYTVAHEIGHVLNMMHDDNRLCRANFGHINPNTHIMSSTMNRVDSDEPWSLCSKEAITDFLESGRGSCLLDRPRDTKVYPGKLPGEMYDVNAQCAMSFGKGAVECPFMQECGRLWCHTPGGAHQCHTRHFPRADGTSCGRGLHCFQGKCVKVEQLRMPKDGNWGQWGTFGSCSRSCGGGVQMSSRECNNPAPENGGKYCIGARLRFRSCNTDGCPESRSSSGPSDFRSEQCAAYNGQTFPHLGVKTATKWIPKYSDVNGNDRCKLNCQSVQTGVYVILGNKVIDGTRCGPNTTDICVQGVCMKAGCDGVLGSKTKFDRCGVCGGGNKHCKRVKGYYKKRQYGYNDVVTIPSGAATVEIVQRGYRNKVHDGNYLAIKDWTGRYLLNGGLTLSTYQKDISINGTTIRYSGVGTVMEKILITGNLIGDIQIQVLSLGVGTKGKILPPRIKYSYYKSKPKSTGRSRKTKTPSRTNGIKKPVDDKYSKPEKLSWVTGRWSKCRPKKGTCGSGWKTRRVTCRNNKLYSAIGCESRVKPYDRLPCVASCSTTTTTTTRRSGLPDNTPSGGITKTERNSPSGPMVVDRRYSDREVGQPHWIEGRWGACSRSCGKGIKYRNVICRSQHGRLLGEGECKGKKPPTRHGCSLSECH
ncbi:A disintegrin and metalloproteinase with thrombospondin motifs 4-like [Styela clava]